MDFRLFQLFLEEFQRSHRCTVDIYVHYPTMPALCMMGAK